MPQIFLGPAWRCPITWGRAEPRPWLSPSLSSRYDEGSGGSGDEGRDEAHKREWNLFYQKQMSLRKVKGAEASTSLGAPFGYSCCEKTPCVTKSDMGREGLFG